MQLLLARFLLLLAAASCVQARFLEKFPDSRQSRISTLRQVSPQLFDCKSSDRAVQAICKILLAHVNKELEKADLRISSEEILFDYNDGKSFILNGGCSSETEIRHIHVEGRLRSSHILSFNGNLISEPLILPYRFPLTIRARIDAKQRFGTRLLGKCVRLSSDSFNINGYLETNADIALGFSLRPSFKKTSDDNYEVHIHPSVALTFNLQNTDLKFDISGVSFLSKIIGTITGFVNTPSVFFKATIAVFKGDSIKGIAADLFKELAILNGAPIVLGIGLLPRSIEQKLYDIFDDPLERKIEKKAMGFGEDLEDKLNSKVKHVLNLNSDGSRVFVIKKDVADLLEQYGLDSDIYFTAPPDPPTPICVGQVCCAPSCGECNEVNCAFRPGGGSNCCPSVIRASYRFCKFVSAPCTTIPFHCYSVSGC